MESIILYMYMVHVVSSLYDNFLQIVLCQTTSSTRLIIHMTMIGYEIQLRRSYPIKTLLRCSQLYMFHDSVFFACLFMFAPVHLGQHFPLSHSYLGQPYFQIPLVLSPIHVMTLGCLAGNTYTYVINTKHQKLLHNVPAKQSQHL